MSCPLDKHELYRLLEPYAKYGDDDGFYVRSKGVTALSEFLGIPFKDAMIILLEQDIWPERFRRNPGSVYLSPDGASAFPPRIHSRMRRAWRTCSKPAGPYGRRRLSPVRS